MATSQRMRAANRRNDISKLYLEGYSQTALAKQFGVSQVTISKDLKIIHTQWLTEYAYEVNEAKTRELARIDKVEREYWEQYEASKSPKKTAYKTTKSGETAVSQRAEERLGDPKYLTGVQWCITERCKILGVYAAIKNETDITSDGKRLRFVDYGLELGDDDTD